MVPKLLSQFGTHPSNSISLTLLPVKSLSILLVYYDVYNNIKTEKLEKVLQTTLFGIKCYARLKREQRNAQCELNVLSNRPCPYGLSVASLAGAVVW